MDINLFSSVSSLVLAVVAIWLALHHKNEADRINRETQSLLTEIKSDAKSIANYAIPELREYGKYMREYAFKKEHVVQNPVAIDDPEVPLKPEDSAKITQQREILAETVFAAIVQQAREVGAVFAASLYQRVREELSLHSFLAGLVILYKDNLISWPGAPTYPDANAEIVIVEKGS